MPLALCIGAQKAGTSWLFDVLATHPDIRASIEKEVDFFSHRYDRGAAWYRQQFSGEGRVLLDASPSYLCDADSPVRAHALAPDARIILLLRDPVERAFSNHLHEVRKGHIPVQPFAEGIRHNPSYVEQSLYAKHLLAWRALYPDRQISVLIYEEVLAAPDLYLPEIYRFLDVDPTHMTRIACEIRHRSDRPRSLLLRQLLRQGGDLLRRAGLEETLAQAKRAPPMATLLRLNSQGMREVVPPMTVADRQMVLEMLEDDQRKLKILLGRPDLPWPGLRSGPPDRRQLAASEIPFGNEALGGTSPGDPVTGRNRMRAV